MQRRRARARTAPALRRHRERDLLGRDERAVRGRDPRPADARRSRSRATTTRCCSSTTSSRRRSTPYDVRLDGELVWPPDDGRPRPVVHTRNDERQVRLVFGSCRVGGPQPDSTRRRPGPTSSPRTGSTRSGRTRKQLQRGEVEWPDALLLLGDQVYADEVSPATLEFIQARRDTSEPPGEQIADFEEYTRLYRESWSDPDIRWLLSTVPTRDDLRRPRRQRRLEHLLELGRGDAREAVVGRAHHRRVHGVLDLPAPREPLAARARRGDDARRSSQADDDAGPRLREARPRVGPRVGREPLGLLPRLRRLAAARARLARGARARRRPPRDGRRGGVGLDRRALASARSTTS